jgi:hypothetical protein
LELRKRVSLRRKGVSLRNPFSELLADRLNYGISWITISLSAIGTEKTGFFEQPVFWNNQFKARTNP